MLPPSVNEGQVARYVLKGRGAKAGAGERVASFRLPPAAAASDDKDADDRYVGG